jgi:hypothetical protein
LSSFLKLNEDFDGTLNSSSGTNTEMRFPKIDGDSDNDFLKENDQTLTAKALKKASKDSAFHVASSRDLAGNILFVWPVVLLVSASILSIFEYTTL